MSALPWILGGGAAVAVGFLLWPRRNKETDPTPESGPTADTGPLPGRWVWPVAIWKGRMPEISDGFTGKRRDAAGQPIKHGGVDIMYRRIPSDPWPAGSSHGSPHFVLPDQRAALAASDGQVWSALYTPRGWTVIIDHAPRKVATYYTHMSALAVVPKQTVRAGQPIGIIGADPADDAHLMHLHFEVWRGGVNDRVRVDPEPLMKTWEVLPDPTAFPEPPPRNARKRIEHSPGETFMVRAHPRHFPRR